MIMVLIDVISTATRISRRSSLIAIKTNADMGMAHSSKMALIDKLLPKLQEEGHRVLIFSPFVIMLDLMQELLELKKYKFTRVDGGLLV